MNRRCRPVNPLRTILAVVAVLSLVSPLRCAWAWSPEGHAVVAEIAQVYLTPRAREAVNQLLRREPGATMAKVSTWAGRYKSRGASALQDASFAKGQCDYQPPRNCPSGRCIVEAINRQVHRLETSASPETRLQALKFITYLVADAHQPLSGGTAGDQWGRRYRVQAWGHYTDLHALWDDGLIKHINPDEAAFAGRLTQYSLAYAPMTDTDPSAWIEHSCEIVQTPGFYPGSHRLTADYLERMKPILEKQLIDAGFHLAAVLNLALGPKPQQTAARRSSR